MGKRRMKLKSKTINTMNQLPLVTLNQAKALREIGFDWETTDHFVDEDPRFSLYHRDYNSGVEKWVSRPSISLALQFMREVKGIHGYPFPDEKLWHEFKWCYEIVYLKDECASSGKFSGFKDFNDASSDLLDEILKIVTK